MDLAKVARNISNFFRDAIDFAEGKIADPETDRSEREQSMSDIREMDEHSVLD